MIVRKKVLLASAAIVAMGLGISSEAQAFDKVNWVWNKTLTSTETVNVDIKVALPEASGLVEIEKIQANIGDVTATSTVTGIDNNPPGTASGTAVVDFTTEIDLTAAVDSNQPNNPVTGVVINGGGLTASNGAGNVDENANEVNLTFDLSGTVEVELDDIEFEGVNDAVDLPEVASAATAVANNQSITSSVGVNLHDAQYNFGGFAPLEVEDEQTEVPVPLALTPSETIGALALIGSAADATDNAHTDALLGLTLAGALGIITPGEITATSTVSEIENASVDSSATAVGNNLSVTVEASTPDDAFLIADLTQFNFADVSAVPDVSDVSVSNYANLGVLEGPLVNSVATAVGNNVSINVSSPDLGDVDNGGGAGSGDGD